jgi:2-amino-4-hydroxy-6-hydroxymethyldihydropteridine diphosphokinase
MEKMSQVLLGLGTNLGQRHVNLQQAVTGLRERVIVTAVSPIYESEPWGITDQPRFLNLCLQGSTRLPPQPLLQFIKQLERRLGRQTTTKWGPRLIDIDILFYDDLILHTDKLIIPHPHIAERAFVLVPLADIAAGFVHPVTGKTIAEMATAVDHSTLYQLPEFKVNK